MKKIIVLVMVVVALVLGYLLAAPEVTPPQPTVSPVLPDQTNKTDPVTHSWYSALYEEGDVWIYPLPLTTKFASTGVEIAKQSVSFTEDSAIGSHRPDLIVGFADQSLFAHRQIVAVGEWDVRLDVVGKNTQRFGVHMIKGMPTIYLTNTADQNLLIEGVNQIIEQQERQVIFLSREGDVYVLLSDRALAVSDQSLEIQPRSSAQLMALPDGWEGQDVSSRSQEVEDLVTCMGNEPIRTDYHLTSAEKMMQVNFRFSDQDQRDYLFTLWPHHLRNQEVSSFSPHVLGTYKTVRGELQLVCQNSYLMYLPRFEEILFDYQYGNLESANALKRAVIEEQLLEDWQELKQRGYPGGIYFRGKYLKNMMDLWEIAALMENEDLSFEILTQLKKYLLSEVENFSPMSNSELIEHALPEFGNEKGNDHHYQYSYYIYVFAKVYEYLTEAEQQQIDQLMFMLKREGFPVMSVSRYPLRLRFLDVYEGHSWANAVGNFGDGNDQESTSEAMFYWYANYLWAQVRQDTDWQEWAEFALRYEKLGRDTYWFLEENEYLLTNYPKPIGSLIWGGKTNYATWFSPEENKILGIQLLPISPGSDWMFSLGKERFATLQAYYEQALNPQEDDFYNYFLNWQRSGERASKGDFMLDTDEFYSQAQFTLLQL